MFCRAQVIIRGNTSHFSWRHSTFIESSRQRRWSSAISWRQNNGKMAERDRSHVITVLQSLKFLFIYSNKTMMLFSFTFRSNFHEAFHNTLLRYTLCTARLIESVTCVWPRSIYLSVSGWSVVTNPSRGFSLWKGIRVTMLFDLLTCIMQCCYIQCMIIQCLIFLLQFQFDFITFHFFFLQSCFRAFDICPSSMQDFHCAMRYAILRFLLESSSCHHCFVYANCNYTSRWRFTRTP